MARTTVRRRVRAAALLLALALAGCVADDPEPPGRASVEPPEGGGFAPCGSSAAVPMAVPFRADAVESDQGLGQGIHRLAPDTWLYVHRAENHTLREDRITRLNEVQVQREPDGRIVVCTRIELAAPTDVDDAPQNLVVAARYHAPDGFPPGEVRFVVNWIAGCPCDPLPTGNHTAIFP